VSFFRDSLRPGAAELRAFFSRQMHESLAVEILAALLVVAGPSHLPERALEVLRVRGAHLRRELVQDIQHLHLVRQSPSATFPHSFLKTLKYRSKSRGTL